MVLAMIRRGEAGPIEHSSAEANSLKLKAKGLSGCHPSGQQPRQPDGKARGPNKGLLSQQFTNSSSDWKHSRAKDQKRKTLTLCSNLEVAEGDGVRVEEVGDE